MFIVAAVSAKYPELRLMFSNVMSQWGDPMKFPNKDAAREAAREWAGVFEAEDRRIVIRKYEESDTVMSPSDIGNPNAPRKPRVIVRQSEPEPEQPRRRVIVRQPEPEQPRRRVIVRK